MLEADVVAAFCNALTADGWEVETEVKFIDVVARRHGRTMYAEAKGTTKSPGLDVDTMYGQLLRRMPEEMPPGLRFAVVIPSHALAAVLRVPAWVRNRLAIDVYTVDERGVVLLQESGDESTWDPAVHQS